MRTMKGVIVRYLLSIVIQKEIYGFAHRTL